MPDAPYVRLPLTADDVIDHTLAALAAAPPDAQLHNVRFWRYAEHLGAPLANTCGWELQLLVTHSDTHSDTAPELTPSTYAKRRRTEQLEVIRAWRKAYFDDRRPRPSDLTERAERPDTPATRPGKVTS